MLSVHRDKLTCKIVQSYGEDKNFATLELAMLYIKNNLWYEEVTSRDEDDE